WRAGRRAAPCAAGWSSLSSSSSHRLVEQSPRLVVAKYPGGAAADPPRAIALYQFPAIEAHTIDVDAGARLQIHARIAVRDGAVRPAQFDHGGTDLMRAVADHRLVPIAAHHGAHGVAPLHDADIDVVDS